ncbi:MAG: SDR family oxidoreductase [Lachnospiraceae bacterium]|nr:SDR family oxidoreductase [Lachnospiraceae bacterium]
MTKGCAIVTGASRGIGAETAKELARLGFPVIINYNKNAEKAKQILEYVAEHGGTGCTYKADVANRTEVDEMVAFAINQYGRIDVLVNNAGVAQQKLFTDITSDDWNKMVSVNLGGVFNCSQAVLPHMIHEKSGRIINLSSIWGTVGASCEVHYSAVKAGIIGLSKALAKEVAPSGITVNCVAPGCIMTDMLTQDCDEETVRLLTEETPLGRIGTPMDIAQAISFLASDKASFITGQVLGVDGGFC